MSSALQALTSFLCQLRSASEYSQQLQPQGLAVATLSEKAVCNSRGALYEDKDAAELAPRLQPFKHSLVQGGRRTAREPVRMCNP